MTRALAQEAFDRECIDDPSIKTTPLSEILPAKTSQKRQGERGKGKRKIKRKIPRVLKLPRMMNGRSRLNGEQLLERQRKVYELRRDEGLTFSQIASRLDISEQMARTDASVVRRWKVEGLVEIEESIIDESNERYDQLLARWLPLALNKEIVVQDIVDGRDGPRVIQLKEWESAKQAGEMVLKICQQRERLNGLLDPKASTSQNNLMIMGDDAMAKVLEAVNRIVDRPKLENVVEAEIIESEAA